MEYFTQAIVLNKRDIKEDDRLFSLYTKNLGKTTVLAKGVRKIQSKMAGHLEPFGLLAVKIVRSRGVNKLSNVETLNRFKNIIKDWELIKWAQQCLNLVDNLVKEGSCDLAVLKLLKQILEILNDPKKDLKQKYFLTQVFNLQLLDHLGYKPELYQCLICKKEVRPEGNSFDFLKGGLVCKDENQKEGSERLEISKEEIKILRLILDKDLNFFIKNKVNNKLATKINKIINQFVQVIKD